MGKGSSYERKLRSIFQSEGYGCIRLAASGGGFDDDLPDLFVGQPGYLCAIEAKYRRDKDSWNYADLEEIQQVLDFAELWGVTDALWAARFARDTQWYFYPVELMDTTEKSVRWSYDQCRAEWYTLEYFGLPTFSDL